MARWSAPRVLNAPGRSPSLIVDFGVLLFVGAIGDVAEHDCAGTVVAFGLDLEFSLTTPPSSPRRARVAVVPAGCRRAVAGGGARMGVCLVDPGLLVGPVDADHALDVVRSLAESDDLRLWSAFRQSLGLSSRTPDLDPRIGQVVAELREAPEDIDSVQNVAARIGLSPSRFEHLFTEQVGCPLRSFRTWHRFRAAAAAYQADRAITTAAHAAGFYDSAHFAKTFRQSFGLPPSAVLSPGLVVRVIDDASSRVAREADQ